MPEKIPISALQHWLYCPRQCALIHLEQAWAENKFTAEGRVMHENAHHGGDESRNHIRITRGMAVASEKLALTGQCDIVELHSVCGNFKSDISDLKCSTQRVVPVEYKRGKPKAHRADEVQLCAQAICLEEMLNLEISTGHLYYGKKRRRTEVIFDAELRDLTAATAAVHAMFESAATLAAAHSPGQFPFEFLIVKRPTDLSFLDQLHELATRHLCQLRCLSHRKMTLRIEVDRQFVGSSHRAGGQQRD